MGDPLQQVMQTKLVRVTNTSLKYNQRQLKIIVKDLEQRLLFFLTGANAELIFFVTGGRVQKNAALCGHVMMMVATIQAG
jgi:hypothetical protein